MKDEKRAHFLPAEVDEQIDRYLEPRFYPEMTTAAQNTSPADNAAQRAVQGLQQHFTPSTGDTAERVQRVWQRLERRQAELDIQRIEQRNTHLLPRITDLSQRREKHMPNRLSPADGPVTSRSGQRFSRFNTFIAVACAIFIVAGAIFTLQRLHIGQIQPATQPTLKQPIQNQSALKADSGVYTYTQLGEYYKLDSVTHKELWHFIVPQNNSRTKYSRPIVKNGLLYMLNGAEDGYDVYALNTSDGSVKWKAQAISVADQTNLSVSLGDLVVTNNAVYYAVYSSSDGYSIIHSISSKTGKSNWDMRYENTGTTKDASAGIVIQGVTNNVLYAATLTGNSIEPIMNLYAIDLEKKGNVLWSKSVPALVNNIGVAKLNGAVFNGAFYYGGPQDFGSPLYEYDIHGVQKKFYVPGTGQITNVVEANGVLYVGTSQLEGSGASVAGSITAISPLDGKALWQFSAKGNGGSSIPTVQNGVVYLTFSGTNQNVGKNIVASTFPVFALNATNGQTLWSREVSTSVGSNIQPLVDSRFVYLSSPTANSFKTVVTFLNLSNGSPAGNFTVHSKLNSESSLLVVVP